MAKSWERPWSIEEIVENAPKWTLAGDVGLLKHLEDFSEKLFAKAENTNDNLNKLLDDLNESSIKVDLVKNEFLGLQNTQFIESRVYEDDETLETTKEEKVEKKDKENDTEEAMKRAVLDGLDILDKYYDRISVPASDSEDEEAESYVLRMKDPYINRPLPYLIGSKEWHEKWHVGLVASSSEDEEEQVEEKYSDTDSESNLPVTDRRTNSTSGSGTDNSNHVEKPVASSTFNDTMASTDSEEYNNSVPSKPPISNPSFAEQLAARLGNVAKEEDPVPVNRNLIQKPIVKTRIMGDILSDEPPPLDDSEDGLFTGKSGQGMFSGGDGLFDDSEDDTDYFSGKKVPTKMKTAAEGKMPNLFDDNEEEGIFAQKSEEKTNKPKIENRGLFSDEESDDDLFSTSNYRPPPSYIKSTFNTIPFIPDEPPEIIPKTKQQDTSRNVQSAQSNFSEISEKSSTSNTESGDLETDNRLLINTKQKPNKVGLFDDPGDLFKDDLFSNAGPFSTTNVQKEVKQKKKLKLFDDEDDDIFASEKNNPKDIFSACGNSRGDIFSSSEEKSHKDIFNSKPSDLISDSKKSKVEDTDKILSSNHSDRKERITTGDSRKDIQTGPSGLTKNIIEETSKSKLFGSDEDLFESNNIFNSTAQDMKKTDGGLFSSNRKLFDSPDADLFSDAKGGLFDSPAKTNLFDNRTDSNKYDQDSSKIIEEKTRSSMKKSSYQDQDVASSSASIPVANVSTTNKGDIFSSSPKVEDSTSSSPNDLFSTNKSQKQQSSKRDVDLFSSKEKRSMFDEDDDGWDKPPPLESSKKSSTRNLFDEDSSDDDLFSSRPPLKKLPEKNASQNDAKLEDTKPSQEWSVAESNTLHLSQDNSEELHGKMKDNQLDEVKESNWKLEKNPLVEIGKLVESENSLKTLQQSEGLSESLQDNKYVEQDKDDFENKSTLEKYENTPDKSKATMSIISEDHLMKKPAITSKKPEIKSTLKDGDSKKPVIQKEKPPIASSKPVTNSSKKSADLPNVTPEINSTITNEKPVPQEIKDSVPPFSLFNDSPPDIDWDTKSETNLFDDEDIFDDIPVSSQKASIFDHEPPVLESDDKSKKLLFENDDGASSVNRVMNLFDDVPPSLDFMVKPPQKNDLFQEGPPSLDVMGNSLISNEKINNFGDESSSYRKSTLSETERNQDSKKVFKDEADFSSSIFDARTSYKGEEVKEENMEGIESYQEDKKSKIDEKKYNFLKNLDSSSENVPEKKRDSPGKIKHNLNINVNALMPGASLPRKKDIASALSKSRSLEETQESVEGENVVGIQHTQSCKDVRAMQEQVQTNSNDGDVETLHSITKNRARIQTKRKPSTRRARQASIKKKHEEDNNNSNNTDDINKNSARDPILDNAGFSTQNNNLDDAQTINTENQNQNNNSVQPETIIKPPLSEKQKANATVDEVRNAGLFDDVYDDPKPPLMQKQKAKTVDESKNSSIFDDADSDSDIFADKKQAVKGKSKLSLFHDADDDGDLFSARDTRKQGHDDSGGDMFKDDVDIFAPKKVTGKKGSLFEDLSGDEDIFGSGTTTQKNTGKRIGNSEKRPARNRNLLKKSEERRVVHDPLDAMSNNFND